MKFNASADTLYDILMDEKKHEEVTGAKAKIDPKVGGKFSVWDDYATGENLELVKGEKIVQSWRASDWPKGAISKVTFIFTQAEGGTDLEFTHENVPEECEDDIKRGWEDYYWKPLKEYIKHL